MSALEETATPIALPARTDFAPMELAYLDSGTMHPISLGAKAAVEAYLAARTFGGDGAGYYAGPTEKKVRERFARLINADARDVCFVPSTTAGEHLVLSALDIATRGGRIVTDALHFPGSFYLYDEIGRRGVDVHWIAARDGRIDYADLEKALETKTALVVLSLVSTTNGFQHDLEKVCALAHARGAYVYADLMQAAGSVPIDVKASEVDFAACSTYKWLMGDFGLGFLYVKSGLLEKLRRPQFGYYQLAAWRTPAYPLDPPATSNGRYEAAKDAVGFFALGTIAHTVLVQLEWSLDYLLRLGVEHIESWRQPMLARLHQELPRLGFPLTTPEGTKSALVSCAVDDGLALAPRLKAAKVKIALSRKHFRVSPSVFNDLNDIDRLLDALGS